MIQKLFRKTITVILAVILMLVPYPVLSEVANSEPAEESHFGKTEASVEKETVPYVYDFGKDGRVESEMNVYFVDGGDIPYAALSEYMPFLSEVLTIREDSAPIEYNISTPWEHCYQVSRPDNGSGMLIDTEDNEVLFINYNTFTKKPGVTALVTVMDLPDTEPLDIFTANEPREGEAGKLFATIGASYNVAGLPVLLNLSEYLIDIVEQDGECYVPLQTLTDLFMNDRYLYFIWTGDTLYGFGYESNLSTELLQKGPAGMSEEYGLFNYNELRLLLDNRYGLKPEHNISDFGSYLVNTDLVPGLSGVDSLAFDRAVNRLTNYYFDDSHSGIVCSSWRTGSEKALNDIDRNEQAGASVKRMGESDGKFMTARSAAFTDAVPMYEEIGDTAFITFDSFEVTESDLSAYYDPACMPDPSGFVIERITSPAEYTAETDTGSDIDSGGTEIDAMPASLPEDIPEDMPDAPEEEQETDTIWLFLYAYQQITRENSPIKNVVIDLSNNGGGDSTAALFVTSWMLGRCDVALKDTFTGAQTIMAYQADVNRNNKYGEKEDSMAGLGINLYCLTSPCSFSCGNLVPAAFKLSHNVTLAGQTSGGGSCVVLPCSSASGTLFQISGTQQLATVKNGSFYNIDEGIEPDIVLTKAESFYDREALAEYLRNIR